MWKLLKCTMTTRLTVHQAQHYAPLKCLHPPWQRLTSRQKLAVKQYLVHAGQIIIIFPFTQSAFPDFSHISRLFLATLAKRSHSAMTALIDSVLCLALLSHARKSSSWIIWFMVWKRFFRKNFLHQERKCISTAVLAKLGHAWPSFVMLV